LVAIRILILNIRFNYTGKFIFLISVLFLPYSFSNYILSRDRVTTHGVWIVTVSIELLQNGTTSNYNVNANSHNLQFTTARTKTSKFAVSSPVVVS
jgi:hypothetical protein